MSALADLERWELSGGTWRVVDRSPGSVTVALLTCDGGTEMDRLTSSEPGFLARVAEDTGDERE